MMEWINIIAVVSSPIVAVLVSMWIQDRKERLRHKLDILGTLIGARHDPLAIENIRALNVIDLVFHDQAKVRSLWREYFEMLCTEGLNNANGWTLRNNKRNELITEMAASLGYRRAISNLDVDRVYVPIGLADNATNIQELSQELLRVLKATESLTMRSSRTGVPGSGSDKEPLKTDLPTSRF